MKAFHSVSIRFLSLFLAFIFAGVFISSCGGGGGGGSNSNSSSNNLAPNSLAGKTFKFVITNVTGVSNPNDYEGINYIIFYDDGSCYIGSDNLDYDYIEYKYSPNGNSGFLTLYYHYGDIVFIENINFTFDTKKSGRFTDTFTVHDYTVKEIGTFSEVD